MKLPFEPLRRRLFGKSPSSNTVRQQALAERRAGDAARDILDWSTAIKHYGRSLQLYNGDKAAYVQYGHVLKETGQIEAALSAYKRAIDLDPSDADTHLQKGHALKMAGRIDEAIDAYAVAIDLDHNFVHAQNELIALGAHDRLPSPITGKTAISLNLAQLHHLFEQGLEASRRLNATSTYPVENYDLFRRQYPIQPAPRLAESSDIIVILDAGEASAHEVRASLLSLLDQRHTSWQVLVRASAELTQHPVASLAFEDPRIHFSTYFMTATLGVGTPTVLMDAGTILDREALSWLDYAAKRTRADLVYADHDHYEPHWQYGNLYRDPVLQPMFDPDDMATTEWVPALILVQGQMLDQIAATDLTSEALRRTLLLMPRKPLTRAHLPRLISSRPHDKTARPTVVQPSTASGLVAPLGRILVVIPTRDEVEILRVCIESLWACANHPERLDILVVDNRSSAKSQAQFTHLATSGKASFMTVDEPFNWSRLNNQAVAKARSSGQPHDHIVFANNDIKAQSRGWDDELDHLFTDPSIGLVGARLLYPDGQVQHASILLGGYNKRPVHDGLGFASNATGPLNRLQRQRGVAAVTGAFMAVRASLFESLNGFDTELAVGYNDVDFCLKVRTAGYRVVYAPSLQLIHFESHSRGHNISPEKIAWDDAELHSLHIRWGDWLFFDPTRNPYWSSRQNHPFDGFQDLSLSQIDHSLDLSARPRPWAIDPADPFAL